MKRSHQRWGHMLDAADTHFSMRGVAELGAVALIVFTLIYFGVNPMLRVAIERAKFSEAMMLTSAQRVNIMIERAHSGEWPESREAVRGDRATDTSGKYVTSVDWTRGVIEVALTHGDKRDNPTPAGTLFFKAAVNRANESAPMLWVCADWRAPPGFEVAEGPTTDLEPMQLPHVCRDLSHTLKL